MRCRLWSALRSPGADAPLRLQPGELPLHLVELLIGAILEIDQLVARRIDAADQLVELEVERAGIAVLSALDQKHHQERDDGGAGVDDQLPGVGVAKNRAGERPSENDR